MAYDILGADGPVVGDDAMGELLGEDLAGDDLMGDDLMGASRRRRIARVQAAGVPTQRPALFQRMPGMSPPAVGRIPLGFGVLSCTNVINAAGGTLTARPQVPWRGSKLIIGITGVNAGNYAVSLRPTIGNRPVLAGAASVDARAFPATGIDNNLIADSGGPGIDVSLEFVITPALGAGDTLQIQANWIGDAAV